MFQAQLVSIFFKKKKIDIQKNIHIVFFLTGFEKRREEEKNKQKWF